MENENIATGTLYVVATPIGNLADITERARQTLASVSLILAEDTRNTYGLLDKLNIQNKCISLHEHNERERIQQVSDRLRAGESIALVSDAGTPLISDPGYPLVSALREQGLKIESVPGACALVAALSVAGLPTDSFIFEGFLPAKTKGKTDRLVSVAEESRTLVYYESPHRILATLECMADVFGADRQIVVCREITKTFETTLSGTISKIIEIMITDSNQQRGEFVLVVSGVTKNTKEQDFISKEQQKVLELLLPELGTKKASDLTSKITGANKKQLYNLALGLAK